MGRFGWALISAAHRREARGDTRSHGLAASDARPTAQQLRAYIPEYFCCRGGAELPKSEVKAAREARVLQERPSTS